MMMIDEVISQDRFKELKIMWDALLGKSRYYSPFLTHDWFQCCLEGFADGRNLFILVIKDGSDVIGIAPLWRYRDTIRGIQVQKIGFITSPDTPFVDFIIPEEKRKEVLDAILHHFYFKRKNIWDVLTFHQWPVESPNYLVLQEILRKQRKNILKEVSSMTPYIPIKGDWETFLKGRSVRFRKTHRNIINRISELKNVGVQCIRQDATGTLFKEVISVSERSWKGKEGIAIASREVSKRFFEMLTHTAHRRGWLFVWLLKLDGVTIAMEYDLLYEGKVYALRADFDEAYRDYSPGAYLEYQIVKHLFEERYLEYSTGPGMNDYKLHWTELIKKNVALHIYNSNLRGWTIWVLEDRLFPLLRKIRDKISN